MKKSIYDQKVAILERLIKNCQLSFSEALLFMQEDSGGDDDQQSVIKNLNTSPMWVPKEYNNKINSDPQGEGGTTRCYNKFDGAMNTSNTAIIRKYSL